MHQVGPIISGPMASNINVASFWWLNTGLLAFSMICTIFLFPETKYHRPFVSQIPDSPPYAETKSSEKEQIEHGDTVNGKDDADETIAPQMTNNSTPLRQAKTRDDPNLGKGKPSKQQWKLWQPYKEGNIIKGIAMEFWLPWKLLAFPIVEFAAFIVSWSASCFLTLNLTQSQVFAAPPYNLKPTIVGFTNFAVLVGGLIGLFTSGPLSDYVAAWLTRRNRGIREPEMRLLTMVPYVLIMILGNVIVAVGYQQQWSWKPIVIVGYTCAGIQVAALPAIASTYAVDSYKPVAGSIFVAITVNKNLWGYGFSKFITPWTEQIGFIGPIMTNMALTSLWCISAVLFWYCGKTFRRWTRNSNVHSM